MAAQRQHCRHYVGMASANKEIPLPCKVKKLNRSSISLTIRCYIEHIGRITVENIAESYTSIRLTGQMICEPSCYPYVSLEEKYHEHLSSCSLAVVVPQHAAEPIAT
jgi:hypothetical protein